MSKARPSRSYSARSSATRRSTISSSNPASARANSAALSGVSLANNSASTTLLGSIRHTRRAVDPERFERCSLPQAQGAPATEFEAGEQRHHGVHPRPPGIHERVERETLPLRERAQDEIDLLLDPDRAARVDVTGRG